MSSATPTDVAQSRGIVRNLPKMSNTNTYGDKSGPTDALSERQMQLDWYWRYYRCLNYEARKFDWNGGERTGHIETDIIANSGVIPAGFYDAGQTMPLKFRKPAAPYFLAKVIVARFTGLLFSKKRHPEIVCDDPETQSWLEGFAEATRLWTKALQMRNYGGGQGTVAIGFKFVKGKPYVELHDARWCTPEFVDREELIVDRMEKRYQFKEDVRNPEGEWEEKWYWYRRIITDTQDVVWPKVPVVDENGDSGEPNWNRERHTLVDHNFGECPIVWIQNQPAEDDIDGDPDCFGIYDLIERVDQLLSQSSRGAIGNCFGAETEFVTSSGVRRFADCVPGQSVTVRSHTGEWASAVVNEYGEQQLNRIVLQRGGQGAPIHVRATPGHRWLLEDGETTEALAVGDRLMAAPATFHEFEWITASADEHAAWVQGFVWGDGSRTSLESSKVRLCGEKRAYVGCFEALGHKITYPDYANGDPMVWLRGVSKELPSRKEDIDIMRAFVRGFVDADGSKGDKSSSRWRCIQVTGQESVDFIRQMFPAVGLYITKETDLSSEVTNYGPRTAITIRFALNENMSKHFNSAFRVVSIEPDEVETVWCLEVPGAHSFTLPCGVVTFNCDPTIEVASDAEFEQIKTGTGNAIQVEKGGHVSFLEMNGVGIEKASQLADKLESKALIVARCMLDKQDSTNQAHNTATEIERRYSMMLEQADVLRGQYGEMGIKRLLEMVLRIAREMDTPGYVTDLQTGLATVTRTEIKLPKRKLPDSPEDAPVYVERTLGEGEYIRLKWPAYFEPTLDDVVKAVQAAGQARGMFNIIDDKNAVEFIARYLNIENVEEVVELIRKQAQQATDRGDAMGSILGNITGGE